MPEPRRARELGLVIGKLPTGSANAITDVAGVRVGHTTIIEGDSIRTGVTAVVPVSLPLPAGLYVGNGYGKLVGSTQLAELGEIETPIVLTATLSTFRAADALLTYMLEQRPDAISVNPVVGETNDGFLSDIRARPVTEKHVLDALHGASAGPVAEGCVGAGTGTTALGFKAGIGTSSRMVATSRGAAMLGVLVQSNFSGVLRVDGVPVPAGAEPHPEGNSCVIVLATDGRLDARQLGRVARRAVFAMGRAGSDYTSGSGDYALAFSTARFSAARFSTTQGDSTPLPELDLDRFFTAALDATQEAILNSLFMATTTVGFRGRVRSAVPHARVRNIVSSRGAS